VSYNIGIQSSYKYIRQVRYIMNHIYLIRLVVLKRPGFQSQKYGIPTPTSYIYVAHIGISLSKLQSLLHNQRYKEHQVKRWDTHEIFNW